MAGLGWTRDELDLIELLSQNLGLDLVRSPETATGLIETTSKENVLERLSDSVGAAILENGRDRSELPFPIDVVFRSFAHKNGIDTKQEFWMIRAVALAALKNSYVATGGHKFPSSAVDSGSSKMGRPTNNMNAIEADLHEWWIQANQLRAILETRDGNAVTDRFLVDEMARRASAAMKLEGKKRSADKEVGSADYLLAQLNAKRLAYQKVLVRHGFMLPSMRINSAHFTHSQQSTPKLRWAPSETELTESKGWQEPYRRIRNEQLDEARSIAQR